MSIEILQVWQVKKNVIKGGSFKISIHKKKKNAFTSFKYKIFSKK